MNKVNENIVWEFLFNLEGAKAFLTLSEFPANQQKYRKIVEES